MKTTGKRLAAFLTVLLLCAWAVPFSASAEAAADAGGLIYVKDADQTYVLDAALIAAGKKTLIFTRGEFGKSCTFEFYAASSGVRMTANYLETDDETVVTVLELTSDVGVTGLNIGDSTKATDLIILYYDMDAKVIKSVSTKVTKKHNDNLWELTSVSDDIGPGAVILNKSTNEVVGIYYGENNNADVAVTTHYMISNLKCLARSDNSGSTATTSAGGSAAEPSSPQSGADEQAEESTTAAQTEEEDDDAAAVDDEETAADEDNEDEDGDSDGTSSNFAPIIALLIAGAIVLAFLVIRTGRKKTDSGIGGMAVPGAFAPVPGVPAAPPPIASSAAPSIAPSAVPHAVPSVMPAAASDRICIRGQGGLFDGKKFELDGSVTIGRQAGRCNICYPADARGVSGLHCHLRKDGDRIELIDLGSSYGTFVNGVPVPANTPIMLHVGDRFWLADEINSFIVYR